MQCGSIKETFSGMIGFFTPQIAHIPVAQEVWEEVHFLPDKVKLYLQLRKRDYLELRKRNLFRKTLTLSGLISGVNPDPKLQT